MDLPVGWGSRINSLDPEQAIQGQRLGDWRQAAMASKFKAANLGGADEGGVPLGFGTRSNTKTLEELSLSRNATEVCVAEVGMNSHDNKLLGIVKPYSREEEAAKKAQVPAPPAAVVESVALPPSAPASVSVPDQTTVMMAQLLVQMDARMKAMEDRLMEVCSKQDKILAALEAGARR